MTARILAVFLVFLSTPVAAQSPRVIEPGETVSVKTGKAEKPDFYAFVGEVGDTVTLDVKGTGPLVVTLFTSEGEEILSGHGDDSARLEAILPATDSYLLAVVRGSAGDYQLALDVAAPNQHLALFARHVGYAYDMDTVSGTTVEWSSCWVEPGVVYKFTMDGLPSYHEILRGWREQTYFTYPGQPSSTEKVSWDGRTRTRVITYRTGKQETYTVELAPEDFARPSNKKNLRYKNYLCA